MVSRTLLAASLLLLVGCDFGAGDQPLEVRVLVEGAEISGANGVAMSPDGRLFVASVIGSELVVLDPETGVVLERISEGVLAPDDLAFNARGDVYWTSILSGEVAARTLEGERFSVANLTPGVNPVTFSDDGRLFVAQCFLDDKLYELDPAGVEAPRLISDQLGPGCGLNGMDWGPDGRLYGPRWVRPEVVSFDVDSGAMRVEASGFQVPAAVKFDAAGVLHVLDTMAGTIVRIDAGEQSVVARPGPGLDNFVFDAAGRIFVSSFLDGSVRRLEPDGSETVLARGGIAHPGGLAFLDGDAGPQLVLADLHGLYGFDPATGAQLWREHNVLGIGELGTAFSVSADGANLILTSWFENTVRIWDPVRRRVLLRMDNLNMPVSAVRFGDALVIAEHGAGQVKAVGSGMPAVMASGLKAPTALLTDGSDLWVTDRAAGQVLQIGAEGRRMEPRVVADGLQAPEGLALWRGQLLVREGDTGRVLRVSDAGLETLVTLGAGLPPALSGQVPAAILNDLQVIGDVLYASNELERQLVAVDLSGLAPGS